MNVEIRTEAAQFPEKEYINGITVAVQELRVDCIHSLKDHKVEDIYSLLVPKFWVYIYLLVNGIHSLIDHEVEDIHSFIGLELECKH
jgi:hypothetical protein